MRKSMADSITNTVRDLHKSGVVDEITMRNIENLCLPDVPDYTGEEIIDIRKKYKLSQTALASVCNISPSTVQKWERGAKKPSGASLKLLDLMNRKGLEALV
ncbi:transcriptional regulator [bacterium F16]|nr:transcriptional regulator [bacterium F16]